MSVKEMRAKTGLSQSRFSKLFNIPVRTLQKWETRESTPPPYVIEMMEHIMELEELVETLLKEINDDRTQRNKLWIKVNNVKQLKEEGENKMIKRTKIMIICGNPDKTTDECLEWSEVLKEHLGNKAKCFIADKRIETPYAIIDFVIAKPEHTGGYKAVLDVEEDNEKVLRLAIGEEIL